MNRPKAKLSLTAEWNGLWSSTTHWWPHKVDQVVHIGPLNQLVHYTCCIVECGHTKSYLVHMADHTKWTKWSTLLSPVRNTGDHTNTWSMLLTTSRPMGLTGGKHFWCWPVKTWFVQHRYLQLRLKLKKKRECVCAICKNQLCGQDEYISCPIQITWEEIKFWQCSALGGIEYKGVTIGDDRNLLSLSPQPVATPVPVSCASFHLQ